jgi:uncharacterized protein YdaU (DUF1376 family)
MVKGAIRMKDFELFLAEKYDKGELSAKEYCQINFLLAEYYAEQINKLEDLRLEEELNLEQERENQIDGMLE